MMSREQREYLGELYREQDQLMLEHREWLAEREAAGGSPVRKSQPDHGLLYRTNEDAMVDAPEPEPNMSAETDWAKWEEWMEGHKNLLREEMLEACGEAMGMLAVEIKKDMRAERDAEMLKLKSEISELKGRVDVLLSLITRGGDVIDLPKAGWRRDRDRA